MSKNVHTLIKKILYALKKRKKEMLAEHWCIPVILATQEVEISKIEVLRPTQANSSQYPK
jgi:protein subunit release factor B